MKTTNNAVLITGGSAGIGFEIARTLTDLGNKVIITGRNKDRLYQAASKLENTTAIVSDVSNDSQVDSLVNRLQEDFPEINVVINNAGSAFLHNLATGTNGFEKAEQEMLTNYLSIIRLNEKLLPLLKQREQAAIVNVSSIVAIVPGALATYSASKAALHSYTLSLRLALQDTTVKVFELMPPLVDTEFSAAIGGRNGISARAVAEQFLVGFEQDLYEIHVGQTAELYKLFLSSPTEALNLLNGQRKQLVH
jgi:uncharacterized oxidoreductase